VTPIYLAAVLAASCFIIALKAMGILPIAAGALQTTRAAALAVKDGGLSDDEKERLLRKASLTLMRTFASIAVRGLGAIAVSMIPLLVFDSSGLADMTAVVNWFATWQGILLTSTAMTAAYFIRT
jgi:hypothetical protein